VENLGKNQGRESRGRVGGPVLELKLDVQRPGLGVEQVMEEGAPGGGFGCWAKLRSAFNVGVHLGQNRFDLLRCELALMLLRKIPQQLGATEGVVSVLVVPGSCVCQVLQIGLGIQVF
jgi:hypothetical protein